MLSHIDSSSDQTRITLKRRILSLKGLCIGLIAGLTAVGFRRSLEYAERLRNTFLAFSRSHEFFYWLLPLMIVSIISYSIPEYFKDKPIYEALLQRDLYVNQ